MKLSAEEIGMLKKLISKRGFTYTDVQFEILDHVACAIEELRDQQPDLSLEAAFNKVHASFGVFGFSELEESYIKKLQKKYLQNMLTSLYAMFFGRLVWVNLLIIGLTFLFSQFNFYPSVILFTFYTLFILFAIIELYKMNSNKQLKNYLSVKIAGSGSGILGIVPLISYNLVRYSENMENAMFSSLLLFGGIYLVILFILVLRNAQLMQVEETKELINLYDG